MTTPPTDITALTRHDKTPAQQSPARSAVPRPPRRWITRVGVPGAIVLVALVLLAYAARDALTPALEVRVAPAVLKETSPASADAGEIDAQAPDTVVAQGPGWIEPAPYATSVQALAEGVVAEVLALEGERVEKGQVVARMIDEDASLGVRRAEAELALARAEQERASSAALAANARADELRDELERKRPLVRAGGISEGQLARLEIRLRAAEHDEAAATAAARAAEATVSSARASLDEAVLRLSRMEIRSPFAGVVMTRAVEPGTRIAMAGPGPGESHSPRLFRIYDPQRLQVRVDVPLADASNVAVGSRAEITTEALPERAFVGEVSRIVHEADIQRNTVEVKVDIRDPAPVLKPEMLARVRFFASRSPGDARRTDVGPRAASQSVAVPTQALFDVTSAQASVWVVDRGSERGYATASIRSVSIGGQDGDLTLVRDGLRPGDRVILQPPSTLREGTRVRVPARPN